mmetsp:Transcript_35615/g.119059  ORF Transcript_35615/g.119059 Transcript_35615/m.119059 type:complete len:205 (+) Transcript_35615:187-801(+)
MRSTVVLIRMAWLPRNSLKCGSSADSRVPAQTACPVSASPDEREEKGPHRLRKDLAAAARMRPPGMRARTAASLSFASVERSISALSCGGRSTARKAPVRSETSMKKSDACLATSCACLSAASRRANLRSRREREYIMTSSDRDLRTVISSSRRAPPASRDSPRLRGPASPPNGLAPNDSTGCTQSACLRPNEPERPDGQAAST